MKKVKNTELAQEQTLQHLKIEEIRIKIYQRIYKMRAGTIIPTSCDRRLGMLDAVTIINEVMKNG